MEPASERREKTRSVFDRYIRRGRTARECRRLELELPLRFSVPLERFAAGRYDCQVAVLDPIGQRVAFWRAPIVIVDRSER